MRLRLPIVLDFRWPMAGLRDEMQGTRWNLSKPASVKMQYLYKENK
jgi:hypothetical protein